MRNTKPGDIVRVSNGVHYSLPEGLQHGDFVRLVEFDHGYWRCERHGRQYLVFLCRIDAGFEYEVHPGRWVSEDDPRVKTFVKPRAEPEQPSPLATMHHPGA